jgi:toxin ParE1/3/4
MKWYIKLSSVAKSDIESALDWTVREFGESKHDEYVDLIGLALSEIAVEPDGLGARKGPELHRDARVFHIGRPGKRARHLLVYRIRPGGVVEVARLLHDAMDLKRHLPEGFESN